MGCAPLRMGPRAIRRFPKKVRGVDRRPGGQAAAGTLHGRSAVVDPRFAIADIRHELDRNPQRGRVRVGLVREPGDTDAHCPIIQCAATRALALSWLHRVQCARDLLTGTYM